MLAIRKWCLEIFLSLIITLLSIASASVFVLFFRPIYYLSIKPFHVVETSGFTKQEILDNYNALIEYFYPFKKGSLSLPTFQQSAQGIQHFAEVKSIFNILMLLIPICLIILIIYLARKKQEDMHYLKIAAFTIFIISIVMGVGFAVNFDATFTLFHKIFFRNEYWLFDPINDPIIKILPEQFFFRCGVVIILIQLFVSVSCYARYHYSLSYKNNRIRSIKN
ncbi:MAG: TIGR01906 family membrane protein [Clostridium sp.]|nr:TIGR01906 family membrane protein [Clostridium sp.]